MSSIRQYLDAIVDRATRALDYVRENQMFADIALISSSFEEADRTERPSRNADSEVDGRGPNVIPSGCKSQLGGSDVDPDHPASA